MNLFESLLQDLRYGVRTLLRYPSFTIVSTLALALGIGVNVAVFTARSSCGRSMRATPTPWSTFHCASSPTNARFSYPDYEAYRDGLRSFSGVIAFSIEQLTLTDAGGAIARRSAGSGSLVGRLGLLPPSASNREIASTFLVSENYFSVLGVKPERGRAFDDMSASELAASPAVLISENYWQRRFSGDPAVLGKSIRLNGALFTISRLAVAEHDFDLPYLLPR
jgi:putative ABC transport system permease protein